MTEPGPIDDVPSVASTSSDEPPRKYLRRAQDVGVGVITRSRQREQEQKGKVSESMTTSEPPAPAPSSPPSVNEQCAICMENFTEQEVGIPANCEHPFCLTCIMEWSKKNNSCPIDRKAFRRIFKKKSFHSPKPYGSVPVNDNRLQVQLEDDFLEMINDDLSCRVCGLDDNEDRLLICDDCGNGYHTYCLDLPAVPDADEWICPLCEVDQLSANEDLYEDSDLEQLEDILFDDTLDTTGTDTELAEAVRQPRVRQTARMRTGGVRTQRATPPVTRPRRRLQRRRRTPTRRRPTLMEQQRQRHRQQQVTQDRIHRWIEAANTITREGSTAAAPNTAPRRAVVVRNEAPRLSIYGGEPIAFDDDPPVAAAPAAPVIDRSIITPREAARRIAVSGIPILSRSQTEPSISRELSLRRVPPSLERAPSRTIRPPPAQQPRLPINQLPRIRRRADAPARPRPTPVSRTPVTNVSPSPSFLDSLLNSQERLHNLHNVQMHGPHIRML